MLKIKDKQGEIIMILDDNDNSPKDCCREKDCKDKCTCDDSNKEDEEEEE